MRIKVEQIVASGNRRAFCAALPSGQNADRARTFKRFKKYKQKLNRLIY
jgi:hypothetical protein